MNTIGKILVILNFLFAIVVGGFLVIDFARRTDWKTAYDNLKRETDNMRDSRAAYLQVTQSEVARYKGIIVENDTLKKEIETLKTESNVAKVQADQKIAELQANLNDATANLNQARSTLEQKETEVADLKKVITEREKAINVLEADRTKYRQEAVTKEGMNKALQARNEQLLEELQKKTTELHRVQVAGSGGGDAGLLRNSKEPNPPQARVNGRIERVGDGKNDLVQLSLGTDQGVQKNHTLEAYRKSPEPTYLGRIRIVDAHHDRSIGRLEVPGLAPLREGDLVTSNLSGR